MSGPSERLHCRDLTSLNVLAWTFTPTQYTTDGLAPGDYYFTFEVAIVGVTVPMEFTILVGLDDPCDPPSMPDPPVLEHQFYTLTAAMLPYTHPEFQVDPVFCPVDYSYVVPTLQNGETAITRAGKKFEIYYDAGLTPLG